MNRLYLTRFELKRARSLIAKMALAPPHLAERLELLVQLEPKAAAEELGRLIGETRELIAAELPDLELPLPLPASDPTAVPVSLTHVVLRTRHVGPRDLGVAALDQRGTTWRSASVLWR